MIKYSRRDFLKATSASAMASLIHPYITLSYYKARKPNIILILSDDQRWDAMSCAGNPVLQTPNIDHIAEYGTRFRNAFVTSPICCASRASFLTGQYAIQNGVDDFFTDAKLETTYPKYLREHGYYTGFIGKWGTNEKNKEYFARCVDLFDYWAGSMGQANYWHERTCNYVNNNGTTDKQNFFCDCPPDEFGRAGEEIRQEKKGIKDPVHLTTEVIPQKARTFLDTRDKQKPFCLSLSMKSPHGPADWDPRYENAFKDVEVPIGLSATKEDVQNKKVAAGSLNAKLARSYLEDTSLNGPLQNCIRDYYRLILGLDYAVGQILDGIKARGLEENTVIIFTSDNGHFFGEHGQLGKWLLYEESIRVPMIIFDPRRPIKQVSDEMVLNIDVAPTILSLAQIPIPEAMQGQDITPLLDNPKQKFREDFFMEHHFTNEPRGGENHISPSEGIRTREWKYIKWLDADPEDQDEELYHLSSDPHELKNLIHLNEFTPIVNDLRHRHASYKQNLL